MHEKNKLNQLPQEIQEHILHLENMRKDFVANVSHELRTPLTVIRGYLELLADQFQTTDQETHAIIEQMQKQSYRMQHIIDDLLFLSSLEHDHPKKQNFKIIATPKLLNSIIEDAQKISAGQHHILTQIDKTLSIKGVENELQSLFSNLIFNAIKYTPKDGKIIIRWYKEGKHAIFQVEDTGIGIPAQHLPRITERFYRVDKARSRERGGTGLGLAIVKHVLLHHEGVFKVNSKVGKGSTFTCEFTAI